nr:hypothetical protein [Tanacetum cinerariifolium]
MIIAHAQLNFKVQIQKVRYDNGTKFKNTILKAYYEKLGIMQQFLIAITPQQNGVVERQNRTHVKATRTMLIFSKAPEFLWAEAISTACFTQNHSLVLTRYNKTLYELLRDRKPNVHRITRKIMETINVKFYELTEMASEHSCLEPKTNCFNNDDSSAEFTTTPSKEDLDHLFSPIYEEYFEKRSPDVFINSDAQTNLNNEDTTLSSSITIEDNEAPLLVSSSEEQISPISNDIAVESVQEDSIDLDGNTLITSFISPWGRHITCTKLLKKHGMDGCDSISTPMASARLDANLHGTLTDQTKYRSMIRGLMHLTASRPFATFDSGFELIAYSDVDHAGCHDDRKSTSGGLQFLGEKLLSWSFKKQDCTTMSIAKAEYVSLSACCAQVIWMSKQLLDYGYIFNKISMYCYSKSAITISCNSVQHSPAFSTGGRILDPYKTRLSTMIVKALICTQDWVRKSRMQINWDDVDDLIKYNEIVKDMEEQLEKLTGRDKAKQTIVPIEYKHLSKEVLPISQFLVTKYFSPMKEYDRTWLDDTIRSIECLQEEGTDVLTDRRREMKMINGWMYLCF